MYRRERNAGNAELFIYVHQTAKPIAKPAKQPQEAGTQAPKQQSSGPKAASGKATRKARNHIIHLRTVVRCISTPSTNPKAEQLARLIAILRATVIPPAVEK